MICILINNHKIIQKIWHKHVEKISSRRYAVKVTPYSLILMISHFKVVIHLLKLHYLKVILYVRQSIQL